MDAPNNCLCLYTSENIQLKNILNIQSLVELFEIALPRLDTAKSMNYLINLIEAQLLLC